MKDKYHCASLSHTEWDAKWKRTGSGGGLKALCGVSVAGQTWDFVGEFSRKEFGHYRIPKCEACLNHENYPLLVLGEV